MQAITDGLRRAARAWPIALLVAVLVYPFAPFFPPPYPGGDDRLAELGLAMGGFPFHLTSADHYYWELAPAQKGLLAFLAVMGAFLAGGVIDRLARDTRVSGSAFFAACGACALPLLRLTALSLLAWWAILHWVEPAISAASNSPRELARLAGGGFMIVLFFAVSLLFDYARVRLVVEDRHSALGSLAASLRLLKAHAGTILAVQLAFWLAVIIWRVAAAALFAALERPQSPAALATADIALRMALIGAQVSIYQRVLASAGWIARQPRRWPDETSANPAAV